MMTSETIPPRRVVKFRARRADGTWVYTDENMTLTAFWREAKDGLLTAVGQYTGLQDREPPRGGT